jgi:molybdopterin-guanine dinucleotide biosynthesis protein A
MGSDKSQIAWHGKTQELHLAEMGKAQGLEVYISKAHDFRGDEIGGFPVIKDRYVDKGPLGAICSAFLQDKSAAWLVVACDMPYVDKKLLSMLINKRDTQKQASALMGSDGQPEPLLCIYESSLRKTFFSSLEKNQLSPRRLLEKADLCLLKPASILSPKNVNTQSDKPKTIAVIGAGAAGMFFVNQLLEHQPENCIIHIFELGNKPLAKVKISGGGRCNVTHACFDPRELVKFYPRGEKELRSGFSRFCTGDVMGWFEQQGVPLKIEEDNRVFPVSDSSQSIIDCLMQVERDPRVRIHFKTKVDGLARRKVEARNWLVETSRGTFEADFVMVATGGTKAAWSMLGQLGLAMVAPVPSLFSFDMKGFPWKDLAGLSVSNASIHLELQGADPSLWPTADHPSRI